MIVFTPHKEETAKGGAVCARLTGLNIKLQRDGKKTRMRNALQKLCFEFLGSVELARCFISIENKKKKKSYSFPVFPGLPFSKLSDFWEGKKKSSKNVGGTLRAISKFRFVSSHLAYRHSISFNRSKNNIFNQT